MNLKIEKNGNITVATLSGAFDHEDAPRLADELQPLVAASGARLAIELSGLDNINSAGLSELISVVTRARLAGSSVVLVAPSPFVQQVFSVTRLGDWFEIVETVEAAAALEG